ncbi:TRAP transporter substrate-binding protein [Ramlibacter sp. 2FC]|uniref:TRAP transporter substrate-binding protein n=1 Tax=Ramlibacter sp. 2FC TaxID=2502188 RepID=UPI0010F7E513|nr:TRAP transporter substrate-binding protein [Ramlibacter sp. 2FC]
MERRSFLQAAAGGTALAAPAIVRAQPQIRWRLASSWPKSLDTIYGGAEVVSKRVAAATNGKFEISVHGPGEIVPALQVADAVQQGAVECAHTASVFFFGKDPTFALDGQIPFGMTSRQMTGWMYAGGGLQLLREFYRDYDIVNFPCGNTGTQMGGWFRKEIKTLADLKGMKFRIGGFGGLVLQRLGVVPQSIPGGDIYSSLEKGTIDGAEFVGPYDDEKLGFYKIAKVYHYPSYWDPCGQITMYVNAKTWEALPKDYQQIFALACSDAHVDMQAKYDSLNPNALRRLVGNGVQVKPFPREVGTTAWKVTNELFAELSAKNAKWKKIFDSFIKYRDDQILWSRFAEGSFENLMLSMRNPSAKT